MRKAVLMLFLFSCPSIAFSQSLAEISKKEKERRKSNAEAGRSAVIEAEGTGDAIAPVKPSEADPAAEEPDDPDGEQADEESQADEPRSDGVSNQPSEFETLQDERRKELVEQAERQAELADEYELRLRGLRSTFNGCNPILSTHSAPIVRNNQGADVSGTSIRGNQVIDDSTGLVLGTVDGATTQIRDDTGQVIGRVDYPQPGVNSGCSDEQMKDLAREYAEIYDKLKRLDRARVVSEKLPSRLRR